MNVEFAESLLNGVDIEIDLDVVTAGQRISLRGRRGKYELHLESWRSLLRLIRLLRSDGLGWGEFWRVRRFLISGGRRLSVIINARRRFSIGR